MRHESVSEPGSVRPQAPTLRWRGPAADAEIVPTPRLHPLRLPALPRKAVRAVRPRALERRSARLSRAFGVATWVALAICAFLIAFIPHDGQGRKVAESATVTLISGMFLMFAARLICAAVAWRERRYATVSLLASLVLWVMGSSALTATAQPDLMDFPAPGEGFFLASYAVMAVFLVLDAGDRGRLSMGRILDAIVTCGGAVCLAGAVLLSPLESLFSGSGAGALVALIYPLLDLLMFVIVLADVPLRRRTWSAQTGALLLGFGGLAVGDTTFVRNLTGGVYDFSGWLLVLWAGSLTLIVSGAVGPRTRITQEDVQAETIWAPLFAAAAAVVVLAVPTHGALGYLAIPAVITLTGAGYRLALALRAARGAAEAYRLSLTDELTGLPNRRALLRKIREHLDQDSSMGLLLVDLDGFKEVNDTLGHVAGDSVLRLLAHRLRSGLGGGGGMLARLGGDEFAVVLPVTDAGRALRAAQHLRELIAEPIEAHDHLFSMNASIGVAVTMAAGDVPSDSSELLRRADIAMYQAKTTRSGQLLYDRARDEFTTDRLKLAEYLRYGIEAGELRVWYQPQVEALDGSVAGLEALVRWQHPELGLLAPSDFLAVARHSGLMPALTEAVIGMVLADVQNWASAGMSHRVSFNFAPPELLNATLLERVLDRVDGMDLTPDSLVLEVTEDSFLAEPERARQALIEIRRHRVQVSIDDYGTGFSSLSYLRDLPVHELKLDRSFIRAVGADPRSKIIVESTTQMARGLGLRTVAEGVEDAFILGQVRALGIDVIQGYHVSRPMPSAHVPDWIAQRALTSPPIQAGA